MISAHKIQERLAAYSQSYSPPPPDHIKRSKLEVLKNQENYVKKTSALLDAAVKFDLGEINLQNAQILFDTGKECADEGLFNLPYDKTYIEASLVDKTSKERFSLMLVPASKWFDEVVFERHPEFIDGTVALNFVRKNEAGPGQGSWEIPTIIAVHNRDFTESYIFPAAKKLIDYSALTEEQCQDTAHFNTTILYVMHSLINARGVEVQTELAPVKLNRRRAQKNRPLLYEHHIVKIGGYSSSGRVLGVGASHASPRAHWRRGHIRTIHRGTPQQKKVMIPATRINGPGFISKDYEISR